MAPAVLLLALSAMATRGALPAGAAVPQIRTGFARIAVLVREGYDRSGTFRTLIDALASSRAVVFIDPGRCRPDGILTLDGCAALLARTPSASYTKVLVDVGRTDDRLIALLGHEFQHALEYATDGGSCPTTASQTTCHAGPSVEETAAARTREAAIAKELRKNRLRGPGSLR